MLSMTLWLLTILVPLQILLGDLHGLNTREYQPAKLAAIEARWETASRVPLTLFAIPDEAAETNRYAIDIITRASSTNRRPRTMKAPTPNTTNAVVM